MGRAKERWEGEERSQRLEVRGSMCRYVCEVKYVSRHTYFFRMCVAIRKLDLF